MNFHQLDNLFTCGPSVLGTDGHTRINPAIDLDGAAARKLLNGYAAGAPLNPKEVAHQLGGNEQGVADLYVSGIFSLVEVRKYFTHPKINVPLALNSRCQGKIDVLSPMADKGAIFAHWFTEDIKAGYANRMAGMAFALWTAANEPKDFEVWGLIAFLRNRHHRLIKYTPADLTEWYRAYEDAEKNQEYRPSRHCGRCPIYSTCAARHAITEGVLKSAVMQSDVNVIRLVKGINADNKNDPEVTDALQAMIFWNSVFKMENDCAFDVLRSAVERVGPITLQSGLSLVLRAYPRETVDGAKAWKVLRKHLPDSDILDAARLSLPKLLAAKAASYNRGEKAEAIKKLEDELRECGAVRVVTDYRLEEVDLEKEQSNADLCVTLQPGTEHRVGVSRDSNGAGKHEAGRGGGSGRPDVGPLHPDGGASQTA